MNKEKEDFFAPNNPENLEVKKESKTILEKVAVFFLKASKEMGMVLNIHKNIQFDPEANPEEKIKSKILSEKSANLFRNFYRQAKGLVPLLPLLLVVSDSKELSQPLDQKDLIKFSPKSKAGGEETPGYLNRNDLPAKAAFVDWYLEGEFLELYNQFVEFKNKRVNDETTPEEIEFREKIAQNMCSFSSYDYWNWGISKLINVTSFQGEKTPGIAENFKKIKEDKKNFNKENIEDKMPHLKVRYDFFRKYLGLPQYFNTLQPSTFKPARSKDTEAEYFCFDSKKIIESIKEFQSQSHDLHNLHWYDFVYKYFNIDPHIKIETFKDLEKFVAKIKNLPMNSYTTLHLGKHTCEIGYDEERKEKYISYYDQWDLDPPVLKKAGIDIDQFNFPFEVYGRIYESDFK